MSTVTNWNNLHRDMVEFPSMAVFKMRLDRVPDNLIAAPFPTKAWTRWSFKITSNLGCSVIHINTLASNPDSFMVKRNRAQFVWSVFKSLHENEMNHALEGDFSGFIFTDYYGELTATDSNICCNPPSKVVLPLRAYISHKRHFSSDRSLVLKYKPFIILQVLWSAGLSYIPNLCHNYKLEREGL